PQQNAGLVGQSAAASESMKTLATSLAQAVSLFHRKGEGGLAAREGVHAGRSSRRRLGPIAAEQNVLKAPDVELVVVDVGRYPNRVAPHRNMNVPCLKCPAQCLKIGSRRGTYSENVRGVVAILGR